MVGALIISQLFLFFAQTTIDPSILAMVGNGATVVVLVWYVIYDVRIRTPSMLSAFAKEQAEIRATFAKEQAEIRSTFTNEQSQIRSTFVNEQQSSRETYRVMMELSRTTFTNEQNTLRQAFAQEQTGARAQAEKEMAELRRMIFEMVTSMRTAVHDVKDTANNAILHNELTKAKAGV